MNVVICGLKGTGKTTLAKKVAKLLNYNYKNDFDICEGEQIEEPKILNFIKGNDGFVVDLSFSVEPEDCAKMKNVCAVFLGFLSADEWELQAKFNAHGESVSGDMIRKFKEQSEKMWLSCQKFGIPFFDIAGSREEIIQKAYEFIESKVKKPQN